MINFVFFILKYLSILLINFLHPFNYLFTKIPVIIPVNLSLKFESYNFTINFLKHLYLSPNYLFKEKILINHSISHFFSMKPNFNNPNNASYVNLKS